MRRHRHLDEIVIASTEMDFFVDQVSFSPAISYLRWIIDV